MTQSKQQAPHFYISTEIEMDAVLAAMRLSNADLPRDQRVTLTAYLVRALLSVLPEHPRLNGVWNAGVLELVDAVSVGVATALNGRGLIAPALIDAAAMEIDEVSSALRDLVARARTGRLRAREINDATFTLSNLGMFDVSTFTAIITPPQIAVLATGRIEPRAVVRDGSVVVRQVMTATLSADHRAVDGAEAAAFLEDLKRNLVTARL